MEMLTQMTVLDPGLDSPMVLMAPSGCAREPTVLVTHRRFPSRWWRLLLPECVREDHHNTRPTGYGTKTHDEISIRIERQTLVLESPVFCLEGPEHRTEKTAFLRFCLTPRPESLDFMVTMTNTCDESWSTVTLHLCLWHIDAHNPDGMFVFDPENRDRKEQPSSQVDIDFDRIGAVQLDHTPRTEEYLPAVLQRSRLYGNRQGTYILTDGGITALSDITQGPNQYEWFLTRKHDSNEREQLHMNFTDGRSGDWSRLNAHQAKAGFFACRPLLRSLEQPLSNEKTCVEPLPSVLFGYDRVHWLMINRFKPCTDLGVLIGDLPSGESVTRHGKMYVVDEELQSVVDRYQQDFKTG